MTTFSLRFVLILVIGLSSFSASAWKCCNPNYGGQWPANTAEDCWSNNKIVVTSSACPLAPSQYNKKLCRCQFLPKIHGVIGPKFYGPGFSISNTRYVVTLTDEILYTQSCPQNCGTKFGSSQNAAVMALKAVARGNAEVDGACGGGFSGDLKADGVVITSSVPGYGIGGNYAEINTDFGWKKYCNGTGYVYSQGTYTVACQLKLKHLNEILKEVSITSGDPDSCKNLISLAGVESLYGNKLQAGSNIFELYFKSTKPGVNILVGSKKIMKSNIINNNVLIPKTPGSL